MTIKTILTAVALEGADDPVLARARQLADLHGAKLILLHALETSEAESNIVPPSEKDPALLDILRSEAAENIAALGSAGDAQVRIEFGKPAAWIEKIAKDEGADLVVIGPGKPKTIRERMFGSTADRVTRILQIPVLVVKAEAKPYQRVAIAMDFSQAAQAAARAAHLLAPEARHELIHITEIPPTFERTMLRAGRGQPEINEYIKVKTEQARQQLQEFAVSIPTPRLPRLRVLSGDAGEMLMQIVQGVHAELLAIGRHGGSPMSKLLTGNVARKMLHGSDCDLLICGEEAA